MKAGSQRIQELRKKLIVREDEFINEQLEPFIDLVRIHCVVDEGGKVHLRSRKLPRGKQVALCLVARYLASRLDTGIPVTLSADELASFLGVGKAEVVARAKELVDNGFALREGKGKYRANVVRIEDFFATLDNGRK